MEPKELSPDVAEKILDADFQKLLAEVEERELRIVVKKGEFVPMGRFRSDGTLPFGQLAVDSRGHGITG